MYVHKNWRLNGGYLRVVARRGRQWRGRCLCGGGTPPPTAWSSQDWTTQDRGHQITWHRLCKHGPKEQVIYWVPLAPKKAISMFNNQKVNVKLKKNNNLMSELSVLMAGLIVLLSSLKESTLCRPQYCRTYNIKYIVSVYLSTILHICMYVFTVHAGVHGMYLTPFGCLAYIGCP